MSKNSHRQPSVGNVRRHPHGARGEARRTLILDTAEKLVLERGPEGFTTNHLAERAGISVGSVYQYFADLGGILSDLGERYLEALAQNTVGALTQDLAGLSVEETVRRVVGPMVAFERERPAFAYFHETRVGLLDDARSRIDSRIMEAIVGLLTRVRPDLESGRVEQIARTTKALYKAISLLLAEERALAAQGRPVPDLAEEGIRAMVFYLARVLGEEVSPRA